jgi:hypothetical protein
LHEHFLDPARGAGIDAVAANEGIAVSRELDEAVFAGLLFS